MDSTHRLDVDKIGPNRQMPTARRPARGDERSLFSSVLDLQRAAGNRAVGRAIKPAASSGVPSVVVQRFKVYRAGSGTVDNLTPKVKDLAGAKKGLSTFEDPATFPIKADKAQEIETDNLAAPLTAVRNGVGPGDTHVSIVPTTDAQLTNWANKVAPEYTGYSDNVVAARTGVVWKPAKK